MKKIFSFTLLIIVLFNVVGYFIVFKAEQFQIKAEIRSEIRGGVNAEELIKVTVNRSDIASIEWIESGEEFRYKGALYDVVKSSETERTITYYCINDADEASLFAFLTEHIDTHVATNTSSKNAKKLSKQPIKLYFLNKQPLPLAAYHPNTVHFSVVQIPTSTITENTTPPPEFV